MSDQSLGTVVGVQTTLLAVSATQAARRSCPGSSTGCCSTTCCCCGRCSSTRRWWPTGSHPTESLVEQDGVSSGYWLCVSWAESSCPTECRRGKTTKKQQLTLKIHVSVVCTGTFCWYGTHGLWAVKSTGRPTYLSGRPM